jgi:hypothetical protein
MYSLNAGWEKREGRSICRWFCAWRELGDNQIAGVIAGFSGGGAFLLERFFAKVEGTELSSLWVDMTDRISGADVEFGDLDESVRSLMDDAEDEVWAYNDRDLWDDAEQLVLLEEKKDNLTESGDMLLLSSSTAPFVRQICELAGLTAAPSA